MLKQISKFLLYIAIFLAPMFFLPITIAPLVLNKHILLVFLGGLALILWVIDVIKSGQLKLNWTKLSTAVLVLLLAAVISTLLSGARAHSFWSVIIPGAGINFILYAVIFFLASQVFDKNKDIMKALVLLIISAAAVNLLFLIQLCFGPFLPWDFSQAVGFNLIGSIWSMAIAAGAMVIILASLLGYSAKRKYYHWLGYLGLILFLISLVMIDYQPVWIGLALGMVMIIWHRLKQAAAAPGANINPVNSDGPTVNSDSSGSLTPSPKIDLKPVYLPAAIFVLAIILIVIKLPLAERFHLPSLISLNSQSTHAIVADSFKQSAKHIIFGAGPAVFEYQYVSHQPANILTSPFWQTRFNQGKYALATFAVELGALGLIGFLLIILVFIWHGFKTVILAKPSGPASHYPQLAIFAAGFYFILCWCLHSADFILLFMSFLMFGLWLAGANHARKDIIFTKSPQLAFLIMLIGIVVIAGVGIGWYFSGKKYMGAINYRRALAMVTAPGLDQTQIADKVDQSINLLVAAINQDDTNDLYLRELAEAYLIKINQIQSNPLSAPEQTQAEVQAAVNQLETVVQLTLAANPGNSQNWEQAGRVYANLTGLNANAFQMAIANYNQAKTLSPANPSILLNLANIYYRLAQTAHNQMESPEIKAEDKDKLQSVYEQSLADALTNLDAAIALKPNYTMAYYLRAASYELSGNIDSALANYGAVLQLEPGNEEVMSKIKQIQAAAQGEEKE